MHINSNSFKHTQDIVSNNKPVNIVSFRISVM